jgi:cell division protein FtsI/penicillin-binding protein 2
VEHGGHGGSAAAPVAKKILARYFTKKSELEKNKQVESQASLQ